MKITNEFTVHTPIEQAWKLLTDLEAIAPCMPGAVLTGVEGDTFKGKVKVKVGPVVSEFAGTAKFLEKSDTDYRAAIDAKGRDARSAGNASAVVTAVLRPDGDRTTVSVDTDLKITGKLAQFGSGMIKEVSSKLLAQFVNNLEAKLAEDSSPAAAASPATDAAVSSPVVSSPAVTSPAASSPAVSSPAVTSPAATSPAATEAPVAEPAAGAEAGSTDVEAAPAAGEASGFSPEPSAAPAGTAAEPAAVAASAAAVETAAETAVSPAPVSPAPVSTAPVEPASINGVAPAAATRAAAPATPVPATLVPAGTLRAPVAEPEPIDLLSVAGRSIYKRLVPVAVGVIVVGAVIVWLVNRR